MYKSNKKNRKNPDAVETILGEGATFEGNISSEGSVKVEGTLKGDLKVDGTLVVGPKGSVTGDISAGGVIIFGEVKGKIDAGALEIKSTGRITGEILIETLITESGGVMSAKCEMKNPAANTEGDDQVLSVSYSK